MGKKAIINELQFSDLSEKHASKILIVNESFNDNIELLKCIINSSNESISNIYIFTNPYIAEKYIDAKVVDDSFIFDDLGNLEDVTENIQKHNTYNYRKHFKMKTMIVFHGVYNVIHKNDTVQKLFMRSRHMNVVLIIIEHSQGIRLNPIMRTDISHVIIKHTDIVEEPSYHRYFISDIPENFVEICKRMKNYRIKYLCITNRPENQNGLFYINDDNEKNYVVQ